MAVACRLSRGTRSRSGALPGAPMETSSPPAATIGRSSSGARTGPSPEASRIWTTAFFRGSRWIAGWCQQLADQRTQQPLAARPDFMNELKEPQVQRQTFLGNSPVGAEPRTQQRPEPFERIDMDLAEPIPVVVPGVLARGMADRLVVVAPFVQAAVDVIFIGANDTPLGNRALDQGADRHLLDVLQHPDHHLTATLQHPEDRRLLLGQRSPAALPLQAPPPPGASFFFTASG